MLFDSDGFNSNFNSIELPLKDLFGVGSKSDSDTSSLKASLGENGIPCVTDIVCAERISIADNYECGAPRALKGAKSSGP